MCIDSYDKILNTGKIVSQSYFRASFFIACKFFCQNQGLKEELDFFFSADCISVPVLL